MYHHRYWQDAQFDAVSALQDAVATRELSMPAVAVSWVVRQQGITSAIIGASKPEQLDDTLRAPELDLDDGLREACDAAWWSLPRRPVVEGYR
jgi:aryl-alcohol dehydrogenase-like predicted oxidoreductase